MPTINVENAKQIRTPFNVYCSLVSREDNALTSTLASTEQVKIQDTNYSSMLANDSYTMRTLADLANGGFPADGSAEFYDGNATGSSQAGKLGIRTTIGGTIVINISGNGRIINSLTIDVFEGSGTITCQGEEHAIRKQMVIPVNATSTTLTIEADDDSRVSIASIIAGLVLEFDNNNIVSCELALRSSLDIISPSWEVSEIELKAYYPDDIAQAISNVGDNTPITYYSGYDGDYSPARTFYLSEAASMENHVVTIKGEDASARLEDSTTKEAFMSAQNNTAINGLYRKMVNTVETALPGVQISKEADPPQYGLDTTGHYTVWKESNARDVTALIMNVGTGTVGTEYFYPAFIDAGSPTIRWSKPSAIWTINEEDCADVVDEYDRNINKIITTDDEKPMACDLSIGTHQLIASEISVTPGEITTHNFDGYVYGAGATNCASVVEVTPTHITFVAGSGDSSDIYGYPANIINSSLELTAPRLGRTAQVEPPVIGRIYHKSNASALFPDYNKLFDVSNLTGSFKFKGDPRMQPRDVFTFNRLDGTSYPCTISEIVLTHEDGGTSATIKYRKGVV